MSTHSYLFRNKIPLLLFAFFWIFSGSLFAQEPFITVWKSNQGFYGTNNSQEISIGLEGEYDYYWEEVDHPENNGNGSGDGNLDLTFSSPGIYEVSLIPSGENPLHRIFMIEEASAIKLQDVLQWGDAEWSSFEEAFYEAENLLHITAEDVPNLNNVTQMNSVFAHSGIESINNINNWDVSHVENMNDMFAYCTYFNSDITGWDVSHVTNMSGMFYSASSFQQPIGVWDVSSVTNMASMFGDYDPFDLAKPTRTHSENETNEWGFNQPLNDWDVSNVVNMAGMFSGSFGFNQPLDQWDVSNVVYMGGMFSGAAAFNQDIGMWDVSQVISMGSMFAYSVFNQPIGNWNVNNVEDFTFMFGNNEDFDQPLENWVFQDDADGMAMFWEAKWSCENFSKSVHAWAANPEMGSNFNMDVYSAKYSPEVADDIDYLINELNWSIGPLVEGNCTLDLPQHETRDFNIYPNPAQDQVFISGLKGNESLQIFDMQGKRLKSIENLQSEKAVDLMDLPAGIYWMKIKSIQSYQTQKFIKR